MLGEGAAPVASNSVGAWGAKHEMYPRVVATRDREWGRPCPLVTCSILCVDRHGAKGEG